MYKRKEIDVIKVFLFILGILLCNDACFAFRVGTTRINFSICWGTLFMVFSIFKNTDKVFEAIKFTAMPLKLYGLTIVISLFPLLIIFFDNLNVTKSYFMGLIELLLALIVYWDIKMYSNKIHSLIYGIQIGFIMNILISLFQYFMFNRGVFWSLENYFNYDYAFQNNIYWYRMQGFFTETSHYLAFFSCICPIVLYYRKDSLITKLVTLVALIITVFLLAIGLPSGNLALIILSITGYVFCHIACKNNMLVVKRNNLIFSMILLFAVLLFIPVILSTINTDAIISNILYAIQTSNLTDKDNVIRYTGMMTCLKAAILNPLGIGFNMTSAYINLKYSFLTVKATFNFLIQNLLELGVLGTVTYLYIIWSLGIKNMVAGFRKKRVDELVIGWCVCMVFIIQFANGTRFVPYIATILAIADLVRKKNMDKVYSITS